MLTDSPTFVHQSPGSPGRSSQTQRHAIEFTGSGSEYFRIWVVNLLLTLLTLGIYYPWAKTRKLKYFYSNTQVAGHALDFHGTPRQMLKGFALMGAVLLVYSLLGQVSPVLGGIAGLALAGASPLLLRASLRFRLANTSWRGLRFQFNGTLKDAYLALGKPLLMAVGSVGLGFALMAIDNPVTKVLGIISFMGIYAVAPYAFYCVKRYQHSHYAYAQLQTQFRASARKVMGVFLKTAGVYLLCFVPLGVLVGAVVAVGQAGAGSEGSASAPEGFGQIALVAPILILGFLLMQVIPMPYFQSRMQNLLWSQTGSPLVRFKSDLGFPALLRLSLVNWVLVVLTLGLYWPFALVAMTRLRLQAVTVHMRVSPDELVAQAQRAERVGLGDAAVDLIGIDIGL